MKYESKPLSSFDIPNEILEILDQEGITHSYPPQAEAIPLALAGENLVLAIPTASGKSLIAYLSILRSVLAGGKALYIVPLRALATEKFEELKKFEKLGLRVELSIGNLDSPDPKLNEFDIIIATSEKIDSLLRHRASWLENIKVIVADEIHLINDPNRGPTLELILARFKQVNPQAQIIALSATIQNSIDLSLWLNAKHIQSSWRPVKLLEGVCYDGIIHFIDNTTHQLKHVTDDITSLVLDTIKNDGQVLIFVNSRRSTESLSRRLAKPIDKLLDTNERIKLNGIIDKYKKGETESTSTTGQLINNISSGVAFHHAGLANTQRKLVESNFKNGLIKCIVATPTLAAGINLPARRVIIRDVMRYDGDLGINKHIPILEVKQMMGRAGRPKYDSVGEAVLIAKDNISADDLRERYILNESEPIYSKLSIERALRTHILAAIASGFVSNDKQLQEYMGNTFYAYKSEYYTLSNQIKKVLNFLSDQDLVILEEGTDEFTPTEFGRRTSSLYIDPETAVILRNALEKSGGSEIPILAYLHAICAAPDMLTFYLRRADYGWVEEVVEEYSEKFIHSWSDSPAGYDDFLSQIKTACMIDDWIEERSEEFITNKYHIGPGDIRNKVETGKWLLYSMRELARLFNHEHLPVLNKLIQRISYGVSEELLELVSLRGVGRVRARTLYKHGYTNKTKLRKANEKQLARIPSIGPIIAASIKEQIG